MSRVHLIRGHDEVSDDCSIRVRAQDELRGGGGGGGRVRGGGRGGGMRGERRGEDERPGCCRHHWAQSTSCRDDGCVSAVNYMLQLVRITW